MANLTARKVHKQISPAPYNFKAEADGTSGISIGFIDIEAGDDSTFSATIVASEDGHKKIIKFLAAGDNTKFAQWRHTESETAQTIEFWWKYIDNGVGIFRFVGIRTSDSATIISFHFISDTNLLTYQYGDGVGGTTTATVGASADTWHHIRLTYSAATDTQSLWFNGTLIIDDEPFVLDRTISSVLNWRFQLDAGAGANALQGFVDAYGESADANYKIGDNVHWRHYKESTDSFEGDDVGTQGTSITWVDSVNQADDHEIVAEFNEHKKILRTHRNSGTGICYHTFASQAKTGWWAGWIKFVDTTSTNTLSLREGTTIIVQIRIIAQKFQYLAAPASYTDVGLAAVNDTWYFIYIQWYDAATDTFDLWIDNTQYQDGTNCPNNQTSGINRNYIAQATAGGVYIYLDAPISSLDSDERADNRTLDYKAQSYDDITSNLSLAEVSDEAYLTSTAIIKISKDLVTLSGLHILQLYDVNSDLRFEGNYFKKTTNAGLDIFTFHSLNKSNLKKPSTYTASSLDPSQILLNIFTAIGQAASNDARLQYYEEDDPSGSHSPTIINTPNREIIRRMAYHADRYAIFKPNGVFTLDADRVPSNGAYTISSTTGEIRGDPLIESFDSQINKVTVYGAFDPDRGIFFNGESVDTTAQGDGTGVLEYSKLYPDLRSDTDCTNRAVAIRTGTGFNPKIITATLLNVYANSGEVINFAYSPKSFSAQNVYVKKVSHNLGSGLSHYELSTGIFEDWGLSQEQWSLATEGERQINDGIFATDINTVYLRIIPSTGATETVDGVRLDAVNEIAVVYWYTPPNLDISRVIDIYFQFLRADGAGDTITIKKSLSGKIADGGTDTVTQWSVVADTLPASATATEQVKKLTLTAANNFANYKYTFAVTMDEAARNIVVRSIAIIYFIKRTI